MNPKIAEKVAEFRDIFPFKATDILTRSPDEAQYNLKLKWLTQAFQDLLSSREAEIVGILNAGRRGPTLCGSCNLNGKLCKECYANRRANSTLDEAIKRIQQ